MDDLQTLLSVIVAADVLALPPHTSALLVSFDNGCTQPRSESFWPFPGPLRNYPNESSVPLASVLVLL